MRGARGTPSRSCVGQPEGVLFERGHEGVAGGELPGPVAAGEAKFLCEGGDARRRGEEAAFEGAVVRVGPSTAC